MGAPIPFGGFGLAELPSVAFLGVQVGLGASPGASQLGMLGEDVQVPA